MTQVTLSEKLVAIILASCACILPAEMARSQTLFDETEIKQDTMAAIAVPLQNGDYNLLVVEQFEGEDKQLCWEESGADPVVIDPLLTTFDFTQDCRRSTDSNGYSMRIDEEDFGLTHLLRITPGEDEILLVATPTRDRKHDEVIIARSNGIAPGYLKLNLMPGWEFTRRTFEDKLLGHFYFSNNGSEIIALGPEKTFITSSIREQYPKSIASQFRDISSDIYRDEIAAALEAGFIAGFEDKTFRPNDVLTREQLVSMAIEGLQTIPNSNFTIPDTITLAPYPDVAPTRWSAAKISWAQDNNIVSGYPDGTFQPTQPVTRAELLAVLRRTAEYARAAQGQPTDLMATEAPFVFSDTAEHWASDLTAQMSSFCRVASPYNETGDRFLPNTASQRNYAAAATLRALQCGQTAEVEAEPKTDLPIGVELDIETDPETGLPTGVEVDIKTEMSEG